MTKLPLQTTAHPGKYFVEIGLMLLSNSMFSISFVILFNNF